jgi:hypothetical protein
MKSLISQRQIIAAQTCSSALKQDDRLLHMYIVRADRARVGKSKLMEALAMQDMRASRGFARDASQVSSARAGAGRRLAYPVTLGFGPFRKAVLGC